MKHVTNITLDITPLKALGSKRCNIKSVENKGDKGGIGSHGYVVSTAGVSESAIRKQIEMQGKEDSGQALFE
ncbi:MAG: hypothetical protein ACYS72_00025 [Planctomycetota bacterium]